QMHMIDLRRQLLAVRNSKGEVSLEPGAVRSRPRYRFELMIQVAIEIVLDEVDMRAELDRQPAFLRLAYDALYYISRCWSNAPQALVLNAEGEREFDVYLRNRVGRDTLPRETQQRTRDIEIDQQSTADKPPETIQLNIERSHIEPAHQRFLMGCVRE